MLTTLSFTFLRFMSEYFLLLVAIALSFYVLLQKILILENANMFADPFLSVLKTTVMFAGEFEPLNMSCDVVPYKFT